MYDISLQHDLRSFAARNKIHYYGDGHAANEINEIIMECLVKRND